MVISGKLTVDLHKGNFQKDIYTKATFNASNNIKYQIHYEVSRHYRIKREKDCPELVSLMRFDGCAK